MSPRRPASDAASGNWARIACASPARAAGASTNRGSRRANRSDNPAWAARHSDRRRQVAMAGIPGWPVSSASANWPRSQCWGRSFQARRSIPRRVPMAARAATSEGGIPRRRAKARVTFMPSPVVSPPPLARGPGGDRPRASARGRAATLNASVESKAARVRRAASPGSSSSRRAAAATCRSSPNGASRPWTSWVRMAGTPPAVRGHHGQPARRRPRAPTAACCRCPATGDRRRPRRSSEASRTAGRGRQR